MNIKKKFDSLNVAMKLMLSYASALITCIVIMSVFYYIKTINYMDNSTIKTLTQVLEQAKNNVEYKIDLYNSFQDTLYSNNNFQRLLYAQNHDIFEKKITQNDIIDYLLFTSKSFNDISNVSLYVNNKTIPLYDNNIYYYDSILNENWYKSLIEKEDDVIVWNFDKSKQITDLNSLYLVRRLRYIPSDEIIGILKIDINISKFFDELKKAAGNENGWFDVVDKSGNIIFSSIDESQNTIKDSVHAKYVSKLNTIDQKQLYIDTKWKRYFILSDTIKYTEWKIVYITPEERFHKDIRNFQILVIIVFFICTSIFIFISWLIAKESTKKIRILSESMKQIEEGNFDTYIHSEGNDEVDKLIEGFNVMVKNLKALIEEVFTSKIKEEELELKALQAQIKPHFLYNTLSSISWLGIKVGSTDIVDMSNSLAKFYKYSLNKGKTVFKVRDEIELTKSYVNVQSIRFKNKIHVYYDISEEVLELNTIKLIVQPFVENSITHGMWGEKKNINIRLIVRLEDNTIHWKIIDDGIGMSHEKENGIIDKENNILSGYGISNVDKRIKICYGDRCGVKIYSKIGVGTTIDITTKINTIE